MPGSHLCLVERVEIQSRLGRGESYRAIAAALGRAASTIQREVRRFRGEYGAVAAEEAAAVRRRRQRPSRLARSPQLALLVRERLEAGWSPAPIAAWLKTRGIGICAESIYRECYRPESALGADAWRLLVRARPSKRRRRRTRRSDRKPLGQFRSITQRPPLEGPGHWEGDLIVGAGNQSAAVVITERQSRYTMIGALQAQTASHVAEVVTTLLNTIPPPIRKTLTWDQGRELAHWPQIETATGTLVFFCRPRSPWEKPLVENTCGLLRRWLARRSNLYRPQHELNQIAHLLNTMPRRIHHWDTAHNRYHQLRVATTS